MNGKMLEEFLYDIDRSQRWLSKKLGITSMTVSLWIKNNTKIKTKYLDVIQKTINEEINNLQTSEWWVEGIIKHERDSNGSRLD